MPQTRQTGKPNRLVPSLYQPIAERWGIRLVLPRYVIGKVAFGLHPSG